MSKDIVKSSSQFVYVGDPNRRIRAQIQIGTPLLGLPQWNPNLEVFLSDPNGTPVEEMGFDPNHLVNASALGLGNTDVLPDGFSGLRLTPVVNPDGIGNFHVRDGGEHVCSVLLAPRGNPDDAIPNIIFGNFFLPETNRNYDIFVKYTFECDGVSHHKHSIWGMLRLVPDPITMYQVMWFVNS